MSRSLDKFYSFEHDRMFQDYLDRGIQQSKEEEKKRTYSMPYNTEQLRELADIIGGEEGEEIRFKADLEDGRKEAEKNFLEEFKEDIPEVPERKKDSVEEVLKLFDSMPETFVEGDPELTYWINSNRRSVSETSLVKKVQLFLRAGVKEIFLEWETIALAALITAATVIMALLCSYGGRDGWIVFSSVFALEAVIATWGIFSLGEGDVRSRRTNDSTPWRGPVVYSPITHKRKWRKLLRSEAGERLLSLYSSNQLAEMLIPELRGAARKELAARLRRQDAVSSHLPKEVRDELVSRCEKEVRFIRWAVETTPSGDPIPLTLGDVDM